MRFPDTLPDHDNHNDDAKMMIKSRNRNRKPTSCFLSQIHPSRLFQLFSFNQIFRFGIFLKGNFFLCFSSRDRKIPVFLRLPFACFCFFFPPAVFFEAVMQSWILSAHEVKLPVSKSFFLFLQPSYSVVYLKIWDWKVSFNFDAALPAIIYLAL